ncbi:MAG: hypothetical protein AAGI53_12895 [Planctomycetota bacterium]
MTVETPETAPDQRTSEKDTTVVGPDSMDRAAAVAAASAPKQTLWDRAEAFISRLSTRNNFWHRVTSLIWLPYAFRSGIRMRRVDTTTFAATLPFSRFNKNWYNAMAGAALLGNAEIAGGMYVFGVCGGDYTVVCKRLEYRFLRPCFGPAEYRVTPKEDIHDLVGTGKEFNLTVDMDIVQIVPTVISNKASTESKKARRKARKKAEKAVTSGSESPAAQLSRAERLERLKKREKRVGKATATFHVTPKAHLKAKGRPITAKVKQIDD